MSDDAVIFVDPPQRGQAGSEAVARVLGGRALDSVSGFWPLDVPDKRAKLRVSDTERGEIGEDYLQMVEVEAFEGPADPLARELYDRLCEATPWRIALTVEDGDRIVEVRPAIGSPTC